MKRALHAQVVEAESGVDLLVIASFCSWMQGVIADSNRVQEVSGESAAA